MDTTLTEHHRALGALLVRKYAARGKVAGRDHDPEIDADPEVVAALTAVMAHRETER